jgi:recombination protein RecT
MSVDEVNFIRDKAAEKNRAKKDAQGRPIITGPWADNYVEMGRKTVLRRLFKYLPISIESLAFATAIDGTAVAAPAAVDDVAYASMSDSEDAENENGEITAPAQIEHQYPAMSVTAPTLDRLLQEANQRKLVE